MRRSRGGETGKGCGTRFDSKDSIFITRRRCIATGADIELRRVAVLKNELLVREGTKTSDPKGQFRPMKKNDG